MSRDPPSSHPPADRGPPPLLEARSLGRRRAGSEDWLFRDVSVAVGAGDCLAVVGPTGSGKTVLLRALTLLDPADSGSVLYRGQPVGGTDAPRFRAEAMYIHQRPVLYPGTVEENLREPFQLRAHRRKRLEPERLLALLSDVGRDGEFLRKPDRVLSGGERQLVQIVRALLLEPTVLLVDEPTAALDSASASSVERLLSSWLSGAPERRALVWVSHDESQVDRVANRSIALPMG